MLLAALLAGCGGGGDVASAPTPLPGTHFDVHRAFRDLRAQVRLGPRPTGSVGARREVRLIGRRLRDAGLARPIVQRPYRNVVATIPGAEPGFVIAGAHYDTKDLPGFVGANDGASGVAVLLELARDLPRRLPGPSLVFAFFDAEESRGATGASTARRVGDRGSDAVRPLRPCAAASRARRRSTEIRAMVLFDMVGDCDLRIPLRGELRPRALRAFRRRVGRRRLDPFEGEASGVLDDHTPFTDAGIRRST